MSIQIQEIKYNMNFLNKYKGEIPYFMNNNS
jgi:hypothetical protein